MRFVTWNVNGIRARMERILGFLERHQPDLLCLQETKVVDELFPHDAFKEMGWEASVHGQKSFNGVALLSKKPVEAVETGFPGNPIPEQARVISATLNGIRFVNAYVVNGKEVGHEAYAIKLKWLEALAEQVSEWASSQPTVILGDFNIAPQDCDIHDPEKWKDRILCSKPERERFQAFLDIGMEDLFRVVEDGEEQFSWWDYRAGAFGRGWGLRIDTALGSNTIEKNIKAAWIDRDERKQGDWEAKPSDHAPVVFDLEQAT